MKKGNVLFMLWVFHLAASWSIPATVLADVAQQPEVSPDERATYLMTESRESGERELVVYGIFGKDIQKLGSRPLSGPYGWLNSNEIWMFQETEPGVGLVYGTIRNEQIIWSPPVEPGGDILVRSQRLIVVEPDSAWGAFVLQRTPFHGGSLYRKWMQVRVFDVMTRQFLETTGNSLLMPLSQEIVQERLRYLRSEGCEETPCDAEEIWDDSLVREWGDREVPVEILESEHGKTGIEICYRAEVLDTVGPCLHKGQFTVNIPGRHTSGPDKAPPPLSKWVRVSEGQHRCTSPSGSLEFSWPQPPPDPNNFCYRLTADGAGVEVGDEYFPEVWSEGIEGVEVSEEWSPLHGERWILTRTRSLCGEETDEFDEMEGECSCTSYYVFEGCSATVHAVFLEYTEGPHEFWAHPVDTEPGTRQVVIRKGIEKLGEISSWSGVRFGR